MVVSLTQPAKRIELMNDSRTYLHLLDGGTLSEQFVASDEMKLTFSSDVSISRQLMKI